MDRYTEIVSEAMTAAEWAKMLAHIPEASRIRIRSNGITGGTLTFYCPAERVYDYVEVLREYGEPGIVAETVKYWRTAMKDLNLAKVTLVLSRAL
jgi:hypothetical protein